MHGYVCVCGGVVAHREHTGVKVRVLYMLTRMFVYVYLHVYAWLCVSVYTFRGVCVQVPNLHLFGLCVLTT